MKKKLLNLFFGAFTLFNVNSQTVTYPNGWSNPNNSMLVLTSNGVNFNNCTDGFDNNGQDIRTTNSTFIKLNDISWRARFNFIYNSTNTLGPSHLLLACTSGTGNPIGSLNSSSQVSTNSNDAIGVLISAVNKNDKEGTYYLSLFYKNDNGWGANNVNGLTNFRLSSNVNYQVTLERIDLTTIRIIVLNTSNNTTDQLCVKNDEIGKISNLSVLQHGNLFMGSSSRTLTGSVTGTTFSNTETENISSNQTICEGSTPQSINSISTLNNSNVYVWQASTNNGATWTDIAGANQPSYTPGPLYTSTIFRRVNKINSKGCTDILSNEVKITVNPLPKQPKVDAKEICPNSTGNTLEVNPVATNTIYNWYAPNSTTPTTGTKFILPTLTSSATFSVTAKDATTGCVSPKTIVPVSIASTPQAPKAYSKEICPNTSTDLFATSNSTNVVYNWYPTAQNGVASEKNPYTTPALNTGTSYWVSAYNKTCKLESARTEIKVTITPKPTDVIVLNEVKPICSGTSTTLSVKNPLSGRTYNWYTSSQGGTPKSGINYVTSSLTSETSFWVSIVSATCPNLESNRVEVKVPIVKNTLSVTANNVEICPNTNTTLKVNSPISTELYKWYSVQTGGTALTTGPSYTTPLLNTEMTYFVENFNSLCPAQSSTRTPVKVTITKAPVAPTVNPVSVCPNVQTTLSVLNPINGLTYKWYADKTGGATKTPSPTKDYITSSDKTISYYVEAINSCGTSSQRGEGKINIYPVPAKPTINGQATVCVNTTTNTPFKANVTGGVWNSSANGVASISPNDGYVTGIKLGTETFTYTIKNQFNCTTTASTSIIVKGKVTGDIKFDAPLCPNTWKSLEVINVNNPTNDVLKYTWNISQPNNGGQLWPLSPGKTWVLGNNENISFTVVATVENECGSTDITKTITTSKRAVPVTIECTNPSNCTSLVANGLTSGYSIKWSNGSQGTTINRDLGTATGYSCTVTTPEGCTTTSYWNPVCTGYDNQNVSKSSSTYERKRSSGINDKEINLNINVYPNPSTGTIHFDSEGYIGKAIITNTVGETIQVIDLSEETTAYSTNLEGYAKGMYIIKFVGGETDKVANFIIE